MIHTYVATPFVHVFCCYRRRCLCARLFFFCCTKMEHHRNGAIGKKPEWDPSEISSFHVIREVKKYPIIYNPDHERYLDKRYRDEIWERIFKVLYPKYTEYCVATKVQIGILLRRRWKSLRNSIGHQVKLMLQDPDSYKQKESSILTELMFVIPYIKSKHCEEFSKQMGLTKQSTDDSCEDVSFSNDAVNYEGFVQDFIKQEDEYLVYDVKEIDEHDVDDEINIIERTHDDAVDDVKPSFLSTDHYESGDPILTSMSSNDIVHPVELHTNNVNSQSSSTLLLGKRPKVTQFVTQRPSDSNQSTTTTQQPAENRSFLQQSNRLKPTTTTSTLQLSNSQSLAQKAHRDNNNEESYGKRLHIDSVQGNYNTSPTDMQQQLLDVLMTIEHRQLERDVGNYPNDLDRMFLLSLLEDLKQIPADKKIFVKAKIATILARSLE